MSYKVTILGKSYELPPRTLAVEDQIETMSSLDKRYSAGELTRREVVEKMHDFVEQLVPGVLPPVEEVDTNDLLKISTDIILAYDAPARKIKNDAMLKEVKDIVDRPEVAKLLEAAKSVK